MGGTVDGTARARADARERGLAIIAIGSGRHRHSIIVDATDLVAAYDASVVRLTG